MPSASGVETVHALPGTGSSARTADLGPLPDEGAEVDVVLEVPTVDAAFVTGFEPSLDVLLLHPTSPPATSAATTNQPLARAVPMGPSQPPGAITALAG
jgi:hypothetical protein